MASKAIDTAQEIESLHERTERLALEIDRVNPNDLLELRALRAQLEELRERSQETLAALWDALVVCNG